MSIKGRAESPEQKRMLVEKLYSIWMQYPNLRLGQLIQNSVDYKGANLFYVEDEQLAKMLADYATPGKLNR